ncbi:hypothetical protein C8R44DRAFT_741925 [Mycena epipterygia]|nr:hypothetical protein C8R44DRAFT_741925 [Mycena epipterygia]
MDPAGNLCGVKNCRADMPWGEIEPHLPATIGYMLLGTTILYVCALQGNRTPTFSLTGLLDNLQMDRMTAAGPRKHTIGLNQPDELPLKNHQHDILSRDVAKRGMFQLQMYFGEADVMEGYISSATGTSAMEKWMKESSVPEKI